MKTNILIFLTTLLSFYSSNSFAEQVKISPTELKVELEKKLPNLCNLQSILTNNGKTLEVELTKETKTIHATIYANPPTYSFVGGFINESGYHLFTLFKYCKTEGKKTTEVNLYKLIEGDNPILSFSISLLEKRGNQSVETASILCEE